MNKDPQRGSAAIILLFVVLLVGVGAGAYYYGKGNLKLPLTKQPPSSDARTSPTPSSTADETASWRTYNSSGRLSVSFKYPSAWYVVEPEGDASLRIQNYDPATAPGRGYDSSQDKGKYLTTVSKPSDKQQIATLPELKEVLPKDGEQVYYIGDPTVIKVTDEKDLNINNFEGFFRKVTYMNSNSSQIEVYLLNGRGLVLQMTPGLDSEGGRADFDQILSTFKFTN